MSARRNRKPTVLNSEISSKFEKEVSQKNSEPVLHSEDIEYLFHLEKIRKGQKSKEKVGKLEELS